MSVPKTGILLGSLYERTGTTRKDRGILSPLRLSAETFPPLRLDEIFKRTIKIFSRFQFHQKFPYDSFGSIRSEDLTELLK